MLKFSCLVFLLSLWDAKRRVFKHSLVDTSWPTPWQDEEAKGEIWVFLSSKDGDLVDRKATEAIFEKHKPTHLGRGRVGAPFVLLFFSGLVPRFSKRRVTMVFLSFAKKTCNPEGVTLAEAV